MAEVNETEIDRNLLAVPGPKLLNFSIGRSISRHPPDGSWMVSQCFARGGVATTSTSTGWDGRQRQPNRKDQGPSVKRHVDC